MEQTEEQANTIIRIIVIVGTVSLFLIAILFTWYQWNKKRNPEVVLHSGVTYTGPTPTPNPAQPTRAPEPKFRSTPNEPTKIVKGQKYAYSITIPQSLQLVRLEENPYDIWAVNLPGIIPSSAVLIGVDNIATNEKLKKFVNEPTITYVENWWTQFSGLTGISSIVPFTNSKNLKGYKAKYTTRNGVSANEDIFFEVAGQKNIIIHLSNGVLEQSVFDAIVDSVSWETKATKK